MSEKYIKVVDAFHKKPYGRFIKDGPDCKDTAGEVFRDNILTPALHEFDKVIVDLTGFNRYGRSFLDEAFGGLIRVSGYKKEDLDKKLVYTHDDLTSVISIIDERILKAEQDRRLG